MRTFCAPSNHMILRKVEELGREFLGCRPIRIGHACRRCFSAIARLPYYQSDLIYVLFSLAEAGYSELLIDFDLLECLLAVEKRGLNRQRVESLSRWVILTNHSSGTGDDHIIYDALSLYISCLIIFFRFE